MTMVHGDHPPFSDDDRKALLLHLLEEDHDRVHRHKNEAGSLHVRDTLTKRMQLVESAQEWVRNL